ncbi:MAG: DUF4145 domain-containing protein [Planctomycetota bacterium]
MSDLELAVSRSKRLERRLRDGLAAQGKGLHELTSSVERRLPADTVRKLRFVATVRNKLVHDLDVRKLDDRKRFVLACDQIERDIDDVAGPGHRDSWRTTFLVVGVIAALIAIGMGIAIWMMVSSGVELEWSFG